MTGEEKDTIRREGNVLEEFYGGFIVEYEDKIYCISGAWVAWTSNPGDGRVWIEGNDGGTTVYVDEADTPLLARFLELYKAEEKGHKIELQS